MDARAQLIATMEDADPFDRSSAELLPVQLDAINERLEQQREAIPVFGQRARDEGVDVVHDLADAISLLLPHTTYKSYPQAFLDQRRWDRLALWLSTVSAVQFEREIDFSGVADVDEWITRMWDNEHYVYATTGTTGKISLLDQCDLDRDRAVRSVARNLSWGQDAGPDGDWRFFFLLPSRGSYRFGSITRDLAELYGSSDRATWLSDTPTSAAQLARLAAVRHAMQQGRATPEEIAELQRSQAQQASVRDDMNALVAKIIDHRHEPAIYFGTPAQWWDVAQIARGLGVRDGDFHPDSVLMIGGGLKGVQLPPDYEQQILRFMGLDADRVHRAYGMAELSTPMFTDCLEGRYHIPPWIVPMVLDRPGERLLNPAEGEVDGRFAFVDVCVEARWGGLITGDHVTADFSPCPCGRAGFTVRDISRYADLTEGEDKITCSATVDSYIKGVVNG